MLETKFLFVLMEGKHSQDEDILFMAYNPQTGNILPAAPCPTSPELLRPASTLEGLRQPPCLCFLFTGPLEMRVIICSFAPGGKESDLHYVSECP